MDKEVQRSEIQSPATEFPEKSDPKTFSDSKVDQVSSNDTNREEVVVTEKKPWWHVFLEAGSAPQIISAAALAIALGMIISTQVDNIPTSAAVLVGIPGVLWLRALKAVGMSFRSLPRTRLPSNYISI